MLTHFLRVALLHRADRADRHARRTGERAAGLEPQLRQRQAELLRLLLDRRRAEAGIVLGRRRLGVVELAVGAGAVPFAEGPAAADVDAGRRPAGLVADDSPTR